MNKTIYFPAISFNSQVKAMINEEHIKLRKTFDFWNKDKVFFYPYLLISAGHSFNNMNLQNDINFDLKKGILLGDSGGFQFATKKLDYSDEIVEKLFNWLENNTNYSLVLDYPPYVSVNNIKTTEKIFEEKLNYSIKNFEYFASNKTGKTKYLNVLHGRDKKTVTKWYENVKKYEFKGGWALGGVSVNLYYLLYSFFFLYSKGEFEKWNNKNCLIHFLGVSKAKILPYISYLQHKLNKLGLNINISYDSSYPIQTAGWGHYFLFDKKEGITNLTITNKIISENKHINLKTKLPCSCPICRGLTFEDLFNFRNKKGTGFNISYYLYTGIHNVYRFIEHKKHIESLIFTDSAELYESLFNSKDFLIFNIIDGAFNSDNPPEFIYRNKRIITEVDTNSFEQTSKLNSFIEK